MKKKKARKTFRLGEIVCLVKPALNLKAGELGKVESLGDPWDPSIPGTATVIFFDKNRPIRCWVSTLQIRKTTTKEQRALVENIHGRLWR